MCFKLIGTYVCTVIILLYIIQQISDLTVGKIVVVETKRKNQVAFLKRLSDENGTPKVQVYVQVANHCSTCSIVRMHIYVAVTYS